MFAWLARSTSGQVAAVLSQVGPLKLKTVRCLVQNCRQRAFLAGRSRRYLPTQVPEVVAHHHSEADQQLPEHQLLPGLQMHDSITRTASTYS
jgi:hypothetical protein